MPEGGAQLRKLAPVAFVTAATIFWPTASISASVSVRGVGWRRTAIASDFLPSGTPLPWQTVQDYYYGAAFAKAN